MSIESLREDVREIKSIHIRIKTLEKELRDLRQHYKRCETRIIESLTVRQEPGAFLEGVTVFLNETKKRKYLPKTIKYERAQEYIDNNGAPLSHKDMEEFLESLKGECEPKHTLKVFVNGFD